MAQTERPQILVQNKLQLLNELTVVRDELLEPETVLKSDYCRLILRVVGALAETKHDAIMMEKRDYLEKSLFQKWNSFTPRKYSGKVEELCIKDEEVLSYFAPADHIRATATLDTLVGANLLRNEERWGASPSDSHTYIAGHNYYLTSRGVTALLKDR